MMGGNGVVGTSLPQGCSLCMGLALLMGLFGWLMLVDGWTTGWPPGRVEVKKGAAWSQSVTRLPRDLLLVALLVVLYLHSRPGRTNWRKWREWLTADKPAASPLKAALAHRSARLEAARSVTPPESEMNDLVGVLLQRVWATFSPLLLQFIRWSESASGSIARLGEHLRAVAMMGSWKGGAIPVPRSKISEKPGFTYQERQLGVFQDLTENELRSIYHLRVGTDCLLALQQANANHTAQLKDVVPDIFLLHLGALMGEQSSLQGLRLLDRSSEIGGPSGLFGALHEGGSWDEGWSKPVVKSRPGITFEMSRRKWRRGLFLYKTTTIIEDAQPGEFRAFNMDMSNRKEWDWSMEEWQRVSDPLEEDPCADSCFYYHEARLPGPLANRVYICARRVWSLPDGGCYWITKSADHPNCSNIKRGRVCVDEYTSASVLRAAKSQQGNKTPAVELSSIYYDDPKMKPIAYNLAMKSAFWAAMQATEQAFRRWHEEMSTLEAARDLVDLGTQVQSGTALATVGGKADGRKRRRRGRLGGVVKGLVVGGLVLVVHKKVTR